METFFEKMYFIEEFLECNYYSHINYIGILSLEPRSSDKEKVSLIKQKCECKCYQLTFDYDKDTFTYDNIIYNIRNQTSLFLEALNKETPLIINITSMNLRLLGALLYNLKKLRFKTVFCLYTEPDRYIKITDNDEYTDYNEHFALYKKFKGIAPLPGFIRDNDNHKKEKWVVLLGFDSKRALQLYEKYDFEEITPIITLPSYKPIWQNFVLHENMDFIKSADKKPDYIAANSIMAAYNYLSDVQKSTPDFYIKVSPFGTKINALGVLLYLLNNTDDIEILYDNPIEEGILSNNQGKTYVFDISEILNF